MDIPRTPEEVVAFVGSQFIAMRTHDPAGVPLLAEEVRYDLTVHDLQSAFDTFAMEHGSDNIVAALQTKLKNQEIAVKAAHGVSGRIKAAAIKLGYDAATAENTPLDFIIERAQAAQ